MEGEKMGVKMRGGEDDDGCGGVIIFLWLEEDRNNENQIASAGRGRVDRLPVICEYGLQRCCVPFRGFM